MVSYLTAFVAVIGLTVASVVAAVSIAVTVDTKSRPAARRVVDRLMQIAVLGAGAIVALLGSGR